MTIEMNEAKAARWRRDAAADFYDPLGHEIIIERTSFKYSKYLTVNINNGQEVTLKELRERFPRINIFKFQHLEIFKTNISLYILDHKFGVEK